MEQIRLKVLKLKIINIIEADRLMALRGPDDCMVFKRNNIFSMTRRDGGYGGKKSIFRQKNLLGYINIKSYSDFGKIFILKNSKQMYNFSS